MPGQQGAKPCPRQGSMSGEIDLTYLCPDVRVEDHEEDPFEVCR